MITLPLWLLSKSLEVIKHQKISIRNVTADFSIGSAYWKLAGKATNGNYAIVGCCSVPQRCQLQIAWIIIMCSWGLWNSVRAIIKFLLQSHSNFKWALNRIVIKQTTYIAILKQFKAICKNATKAIMLILNANNTINIRYSTYIKIDGSKRERKLCLCISPKGKFGWNSGSLIIWKGLLE